MKSVLILLTLLIPSVAFGQAISNSVSRGISNPVTDAGPEWFHEQAAKPTVYPNRGVCYGKENPATSKWGLYCEDEDGVEYLLIPGGGVVPGSAQWCGKTALTYDGNDAGSYAGANALCTTVGTCTSGHVCDASELGDLIDQGSTFGGETASLWINAHHTGYPLVLSNDCEGWSVATGAYGNYFDLTNMYARVTACDVTGTFKLAYACCQ